MSSLSNNLSAYIGTENGIFRARLGERETKAQMLGLRGKGPVIASFSDKKDPRRIVAATQTSGMFRSDDGGQFWKETNHGLVTKQLGCVRQHTRSGFFYLGNSNSEIYESINAADSWVLLSSLKAEEKPPQHARFGQIDDIGLHFANPNFIFVALQNHGVFRTLDKGITWEQVGNLKNHRINSLLPMSDNPAILICATDRGMLRSTNAGESFQEVIFDAERPEKSLLVGHYSTPNVLFSTASKNDVSPDKAVVGRSYDQGQTWRPLSFAQSTVFASAPRALAINPDDPKMILVGTRDGTIWLSESSGDHFRKYSSGLPSIYSLAIF